jgi:hypothetical protein
MYESDDHARVFADVARYGLEHRNQMSLTPLMMAAAAGNVPLVEALLERGARVDAVDAFGRMPLHWALQAAFASPSFASEAFGALYELLCPTGLDLEVDGRLMRLNRTQGEFFVLASMIALLHELYAEPGSRYRGFSATMLDDKALAAYEAGLAHEPESEELKEGVRRCVQQINKGARGELSEEEAAERRERAMADPEIQLILTDPIMRQVLNDFAENPKAAQHHTKNADIMAKLQKLIAAGIVRMG